MTGRDERPTLFVERDGTLNEEVGFLSDQSLGFTPIRVRTGVGVQADTELPPDLTARGGRVFDDLPQAFGQLLLTRSRRP